MHLFTANCASDLSTTDINWYIISAVNWYTITINWYIITDVNWLSVRRCNFIFINFFLYTYIHNHAMTTGTHMSIEHVDG